jgi:hypothetical protein
LIATDVDLTDVGRVAGDVWHHLSLNGETSSLKLRSALQIPQSLLFLSLGWLAREGKIRLISGEQGFLISLKQS